MILDELAAYAAYRVEEAQKKLSPEEICTQAEHLPKGDFRFEKTLKKKGMSFICEVKKASPSTQSMLPCAACSPSTETVPNWLFMVAALNACAGT